MFAKTKMGMHFIVQDSSGKITRKSKEKQQESQKVGRDIDKKILSWTKVFSFMC